MASIVGLKLYRAAVPLKKVVKHASFERSVSENLVVRVELSDGSVGYGEGVPRSYVTGETVETAFALLSAHDWSAQIGQPGRFRRGRAAARVAASPGERGRSPRHGGQRRALRLELAVLDAYGRRFGESIGRAVELATAEGLARHPTPQPVRYSGAITAESTWGEWRTAGEDPDLRVPPGEGEGRHRRGRTIPRRLKALRRILGRRMDIRLDANEAWPASELLERVEPLRRYRPTALEQPVPHAEVDALAELRPRLGIPIMLDESLCGFPDAEAAVARRTADILNVRISKCGGLLASLRIIALAQRSGLGVQLGCHPGETALLSAAGRHLASRVAGLRYVEGSYDRHILGANLTRQDLTFRYGGWAKPLDGPGSGVEVDPAALEAMTVESREIRYD